LSGHSHWSRIKHKKAVLDARRGKSWSKLARAVTMAAQIGGGNVSDNPRLRLAIDKAKAENMPKDTIEKAVKKGTGELDGESYEEVLYEGYGPGGVAVMARAMTDNRNRTSGEIRKIFERAGGNLGSSGCVSFQFQQKGVILVDGEKLNEERMMELALEAGAEDVQAGLMHEVHTTPDTFEQIKNSLAGAGVEIQSADLRMVSNAPVTLGLEAARKAMRLIDALEEQDDVDAVYSNVELSDEVMTQLEKE
jgi:YebC/PmpR family DNA-binding regulatory protein